MSRRTIIIIVVLLVGLQVALAGSKLSGLKKRLAVSLGVIMGKKASPDVKSAACKKIAAIVTELGELNDLKAVKLMFSCFPNADTVEVFEAFKAALPPLKDKADIRPYLVKQMTSKRTPWEIRCVLIEIYKEDEGQDVFDALIILMKDRSEKVQRDAINALKDRDETRAVGPLIDFYTELNEKDKEGLIWILIREALHALTGHDEADPANWKQWWDAVREGFNQDEERGESGGSTSRTSAAEKKKLPKFFGTEIRSKRIMFLIDCSGSMVAKDPKKKRDDAAVQPKPGQPRPQSGSNPFGGDPSLPLDRMRIKRVQKELRQCIESLEPNVKFNIIAFSTGAAAWKEKLMPATARNKIDSCTWVDKFSPMGCTSTDVALRKAFEDKEFDHLFLLSDGHPFRQGDLPLEPIYEFVNNANKQRKVKIFTYGFVTPDSYANDAFLRKLSGDWGGTFTDIP
ncbi:MAG: hypothetical protein E3J72_06945 [Planctomycetota bacterium]|nr:MAG: hypothetical protein E3J72_06945 [Planctomycetota bacterium]